jgi:hypothetical protein
MSYEFIDGLDGHANRAADVHDLEVAACDQLVGGASPDSEPSRRLGDGEEGGRMGVDVCCTHEQELTTRRSRFDSRFNSRSRKIPWTSHLRHDREIQQPP